MTSHNLTTYWCPSLDIPSVLDQVIVSVRGIRYALLTVLDSTSAVAELSSVKIALNSVGATYSVIGSDIVIDITTLLDLLQCHELFTGFDELWLAQQAPLLPKPVDLRITSDLSFAESVPVGLMAWMAGAGCLVGLGDGDGLNVASFIDGPIVDLAPVFDP